MSPEIEHRKILSHPSEGIKTIKYATANTDTMKTRSELKIVTTKQEGEMKSSDPQILFPNTEKKNQRASRQKHKNKEIRSSDSRPANQGIITNIKNAGITNGKGKKHQ